MKIRRTLRQPPGKGFGTDDGWWFVPLVAVIVLLAMLLGAHR